VNRHGYDPTIGFLHSSNSDRHAFVLDLMEPLRPIVDRKVLEFVQSQVFHPADFTIENDGVCRLNSEMAKHVAGLARTQLEAPVIVDFLISKPAMLRLPTGQSS